MRLAGEIRLRASLLLRALLAALHVTALLLLFYPGVDSRLRWIGIPLVAMSALLAWRQERSTRGVRLRLRDDGSAEEVDAAGCARPIVFNQCSRDGGWFLALCWCELASAKKRRAWLLASAMPADEWRLIRAWLRWRAFSRERTSSEAGRPASADF